SDNVNAGFHRVHTGQRVSANRNNRRLKDVQLREVISVILTLRIEHRVSERHPRRSPVLRQPVNLLRLRVLLIEASTDLQTVLILLSVLDHADIGERVREIVAPKQRYWVAFLAPLRQRILKSTL